VEPTITLETLGLLHDAGYWRQDANVLTFIFENYVNLGLNHNEFGSEEFWLRLYEGDEARLLQCGGGVNLQDYYRLGEVYNIHVRRFNKEAQAWDLEFVRFDGRAEPRRFFIRILEHAFRRLLTNCTPEDRVGMEIRHPSLHKRVIVPFKQAQHMTHNYVLSIIVNNFQVF